MRFDAWFFALVSWFVLSGCPKSEAPTRAVAPSSEPLLAAEIQPPMISRTKVVQLVRKELSDGRGVWVAAGAPVDATEHYSGDTPEGLEAGEQKMVFEGESSGDYDHLTFTVNGSRFDFGAGDNQLEGSPLETEEGRTAAVGKTFLVKWDYRRAVFPCCQGDTTTWVGMKPSILSVRAAD